MDDEDTLLPRKLQAALEQALERKNELISQDSDSDSDDGEGRIFLLGVWTSQTLKSTLAPFWLMELRCRNWVTLVRPSGFSAPKHGTTDFLLTGNESVLPQTLFQATARDGGTFFTYEGCGKGDALVSSF